MLLIILIGLQSLLKMIIITQLQIILLNMGVDFNEANYIMNAILIYIPYLINVILAIVILNDLIKNKIKGISVVLLTIMSYFAGVIFFLFLINNKISSNDK
jgi:hypothetical protein